MIVEQSNKIISCKLGPTSMFRTSSQFQVKEAKEWKLFCHFGSSLFSLVDSVPSGSKQDLYTQSITTIASNVIQGHHSGVHQFLQDSTYTVGLNE